METECHCCSTALKKLQKAIDEKGIENLTIDDFKKIQAHCESCWNRWHNGERDKDYEDWGRFKHLEKTNIFKKS